MREAKRLNLSLAEQLRMVIRRTDYSDVINAIGLVVVLVLFVAGLAIPLSLVKGGHWVAAITIFFSVISLSLFSADVFLVDEEDEVDEF